MPSMRSALLILAALMLPAVAVAQPEAMSDPPRNVDGSPDPDLHGNWTIASAPRLSELTNRQACADAK